MKSEDLFITTEELAERWSGMVVIGTLKNWRSKKKGPKYVKLGRDINSRVAYRMSDVVEFEKKMTKEPRW